MTAVDVVRFRSAFAGGRGVLTAELARRPEPRWSELFELNRPRYTALFEETPSLVEDAIVVPVRAHELTTAEMALIQLVGATNWLFANSPDGDGL